VIIENSSSDSSTSSTSSSTSLSTFEDRPFFEKALRHGVAQGIITNDKIDAINLEAPKGLVQIATAFGSPYLRAEMELARLRIVNLVSLYLSETSHSDLDAAARLIRDHTFLTLSRGGSTMLKELFALPEYSILGSSDHGRVEDFLEFWSRKKSIKDYQETRKQRQHYQREIQLAKKLSVIMGLPRSIFQDQHCEADALIRSALLIGMQKGGNKTPHCFDQIEFASLLETMRKKGLHPQSTINIELTEDEQHIIQLLQQDIVTNDLPKINNKKIPLDALINKIKNRYFIRGHEMEDTASYDALVSKEWSKHTKGQNDIDAIFTLLLCIAAKLPNKISLSETAAKSLIKKVRKEGFFPELASQFIKQHAPFEKQESLLEDWVDFCEQAEIYLLDDEDTNLNGALHFLYENCYVEKAAKKLS
jgi:hypothetical protein